MNSISRHMRYQLTSYLFWVVFAIIMSSCTDFLDVPLPKSKIERSIVFESEAAAELAVIGIYSSLIEQSAFSNGGLQSVTMIAGLSADELQNNLRTDPLPLEFEENDITAFNGTVLILWTSLYRTIYLANSAIEGLKGSTAISESKKASLEGEVLFIRAFCYFYLVNLFGDVPLIMSTDYKVNANFGRTDMQTVYNQIKTDLLSAQSLMPMDYDGEYRTRVNQGCATALLARVYLYLKEWSNAEAQATLILQDSRYALEELDEVFLKDSNEAIWQLRQLAGSGDNGAVVEAYLFLPPNVVNNNVLRAGFQNIFPLGDLRGTKWIGKYFAIYHPFKYKQSDSNKPFSEFSMVLRVAEQYLIRSEARTRLGNFTGPDGATADLDSVRHRAGLGPTAAQSETELLSAIEQERQKELFTEWGHRWFDLKRTGRADVILHPIKPKWTINDMLYPIPQQERNKNKNLYPQNPGY